MTIPLPRNLRVYDAQASRQQDADRLVHTEDEFRRVLWMAADPEYRGTRPSTIRLAADIHVKRPVMLGTFSYPVVIDGGDRFGFRVADGVECYFDLEEHEVSDLVFRGVSFEAIEGGGYVLLASSSAAKLRRVSFIDCKAPLALIGSRSTPPVVESIVLEDRSGEGSVGVPYAGEARVGSAREWHTGDGDEISIGNGSATVAAGSGARLDVGSDVVLESSQATRLEIGEIADLRGRFASEGLTERPSQTIVDAVEPLLKHYGRSLVTVDVQLDGDLLLEAGDEDGQRLTLFFEAIDDKISPTIQSGPGQVLQSPFVPVAGSVLDLVWLDGAWRELSRSPIESGGGGGPSIVVGERLLDSKDPPLDLYGLTYCRVASTKDASGSIVLSNGVDGQRVVLCFTEYAGTAQLTDNIGGFRGAGDFIPTSLDTIDLVYDALLGSWVEVSRSVN